MNSGQIMYTILELSIQLYLFIMFWISIIIVTFSKLAKIFINGKKQNYFVIKM